jgi:sugar lactone lactonase YvrE
VDRFGHIYVIDALFDTLQVFARDGSLLLTLGGPGSGAGEFWLPNGIAVGRDDRIYVADAYNGRLQIFKYLARE